MKKLLFVFALVAACVSTAFAATPAEESAERIVKLQKLLEKVPAQTGVTEIDSYAAKTAEAATLAVSNSVLLNAALGGDLSVLVQLATDVKNEGEAVKDATQMSVDAAKAIKKINPMKAGKAKKALDFANNSLTLVTEESVYQAQTVASLAK